jgi:hypothetical protein
LLRVAVAVVRQVAVRVDCYQEQALYRPVQHIHLQLVLVEPVMRLVVTLAQTGLIAQDLH